MRILILGGTAWLGRQLVASALAAGHEVTALARGQAGDPPGGVRFVAADREHDDAFATLSGEQADAVIDVSRQPGQVRRAVERFADAHWVYVSTASVYAESAAMGEDESGELLPALEGDIMRSMEEYGPAKVACERYVLDGVRSAFVSRPSLIGGPGDRSGRSGYWPRRFAHPSNPEGRVLIPDAPDTPVQVLDVRDFAQWLVECAARGTTGIANAGGPTHTLAEHLETVRGVTGFTGSWQVVAEDWLAEHDVQPWAGPRSLPLWLPAESYPLAAHDLSRAASLGLRTRPLTETLADTLAWELAEPGERGAGLSDADERELLALL